LKLETIFKFLKNRLATFKTRPKTSKANLKLKKIKLEKIEIKFKKKTPCLWSEFFNKKYSYLT